jgi:hypothetical protein
VTYPEHTVIDNIISGDVVEENVLAFMKTWMRTYAEEIRLQRGLTESLPDIKTWEIWTELSVFDPPQLPALLVMTPGTVDTPWHDADGFFFATWRIAMAIIVTAKDSKHARRNAKMYAAAARAIVVQHESLGGMSMRSTWQGENYDDTPTDGQRTLWTATVVFDTTVAEVMNKEGGPIQPFPPDPDTIPGSVWPRVHTTHPEVDKIPLDQVVPHEQPEEV